MNRSDLVNTLCEKEIELSGLEEEYKQLEVAFDQLQQESHIWQILQSLRKYVYYVYYFYSF